MDSFKELLQSINFDFDLFWKAALLLTIGCLVLGFVGKFAFGKHSILDSAVSSAIGILFVYGVTVVFYSLGAQYHKFVSPLPFVELSGDTMKIFVFEGADFLVICEQLVKMIILAFLANLIDSGLPRGNNFFTWLIFRCLTIVLAIALQWGVTWLFQTFLPQGFLTYSPAILLGILVLMLAVGLFKIIVGAAIATVNPLVGAIYTFFFATFIGKALSKAVLTTIILSALVWGLNRMGITTVAIGTAALAAYIPLVIVVLLLWYLFNHIL